ncbi:MAG: hypothetical protein EOO47_21800 [Flavobacterium sp.]|nr:MAG: hypothetical protein EOO47_21800 [Flavobacterium sp.]
MLIIQKTLSSFHLYLMLLSLVNCAETNSIKRQVKPTTSKNVVVSKPKVTQTKKAIPIVNKQTHNFAGSYAVTYQNKEMFITLLANDDVVIGTFLMNGEQAKINGIVRNLICTGKIVEDQTGKAYNFKAERRGELLDFSFTIPEQNNQLVNLVLKKVNTPSTNTANTNKNPMLIGTWRNTEVLSSGSGEFYTSFATDYFVKLDANGVATIWTGKSAGGSNGITIESAKEGSLQKMEWYTVGKILYLVNPITKQKAPVNFYAEANRMMLTSGSTKKVYHRVK